MKTLNEPHNPVIPGNYADPFVYKHGDDYYLVATSEGDRELGPHFDIFHSTDLVNWSERKEILNFRDVEWADGMAWAPSLLCKDGYWYFVFCGNQQIGMAVCDEPMGTYRDILGKPLLERGYLGIQTIDPSLFMDTDGKTYLVWGNTKCFISEIFLSPDDVHLVGNTVCISDEFNCQRTAFGTNPAIFCEGADLTKVGDRYLLTWSIYDFRDYRYAIRYAWAERVMGPYIQPLAPGIENIMLQTDGKILGTGHGNVVEYKGNLWSFYHRMSRPYRSYSREVCCDLVSFADEFRLKVIPTK